MSLVLKSNQVATRSLGNINGIIGKQNWAIFLDFENEQYFTKTNGNVTNHFDLTQLVQVSRANLNGKPISISKNGLIREITSTTEPRTALLRNGHFGLLVEDLNENFFINSSAPASQVIEFPVSPQSGNDLIVSVIGTGSVTVSGNNIGASKVVTQATPTKFERTATEATILNITVNGQLSHVQVEYSTGFATATSKVTTGSTSVTRARELVKLNRDLLNQIIPNLNNVTVVAQTFAYDTVVNQTKITHAHVLGFNGGTSRSLAIVGHGVNAQAPYYTALRKFVDNVQVEQGTSKFIGDSSNLNYPFVTCLMKTGEVVKSCSNGSNISEHTSFNIEDIVLGYGYSSPIGINGLRGIVTKLLVYPYALSDAELIQISKSWL